MFCDMCSYCMRVGFCLVFFFFFKQKTAYEMRISDWSSDVCSSDLVQSKLHVPPRIQKTQVAITAHMTDVTNIQQILTRNKHRYRETTQGKGGSKPGVNQMICFGRLFKSFVHVALFKSACYANPEITVL